MDISTLLLLFVSMIVLAVIPGPGVFVVVARSIAGGFRHGFMASLGIVLGDYVFILLAVYGLIAIAEMMGSLFIIIKYVGAAYLIWLGIQLFRANSIRGDLEKPDSSSYTADCMVGLITTLGNPKAILFYLSFFPAFLDLSVVSTMDVALILFTATLSVGGVMLGYAYLAAKTTSLFKSEQFNRNVNVAAGSVLIGSGTLMALKS